SLVDGSVLRRGETLGLVHDHISAADLVITQSERQRQLAMENLGVDSVVVGSGIPIPPPSAELPEDGYVLWVGRCDPIKRPWVFLELAKRAPERRFAMVLTPGLPLLFDELHTEAAGIPNLEMISRVPYAEMQELYAGSGLVVSTSISEGMPNVFIEAAAAGRPFVSYAVDPQGLLTDGRAGVCAGNDFDVLTDVVRELMADPVKRTRMGMEGRALAERTWDVRLTARRYVDALCSLFQE
ncbi:MAG: glycosyltransferase family 4 protein, partial [Coriobacteriia bacterium]|nr:glycosyltransferase family 4 protein [Coriobacteriia bacterium]